MKLPLVLAILLSLYGYLSYTRLPRDIDPKDSTRAATVTAHLPGAHAADLERAVTIPLERTLTSCQGVRDIAALTRDGTLSITFALDPDSIQNHPGGVADLIGNIRDRLDALRPALLTTAPHLTGPFLNSDALQTFDALILTKVGSGGSPDRKEPPPPTPTPQADLLNRLRAHPAIALAETTNTPAKAVEIHYEDEDLADAGLTPADLAKLLRAQNFLAPGGYLTTENSLIAPVSVASLPDGLEALREIPIRDPSDGAISPLSDICEITLTETDPKFGGVFSDDSKATAIVVNRAPDAPPGAFAAAVEEITDSSSDAKILLLRSDEADLRLGSAANALLYGALAVFICLALAFGLRTGIAAALAIPATVLTGCAVLNALGVDLNIVSLSAFALALGILMDNHIVVAHRARILRRDGLDAGTTRKRTVRELASPLVAAALTTIAGFLPAWLLRGGPGGYFADLFLVIAVLIAVSQLYGFTLTPALAAAPKSHHSPGLSLFARTYLKLLRPLLEAPVLGLVAIVLLTIAAIPLLKSVPDSALPNVPTKFLAIDLEFPPGTDRETVAEAAEKIRADIRLSSTTSAKDDADKMPVPNTVATFLGTDAPPVFSGMNFRPPAPHRAQIIAAFTSPDAAKRAAELVQIPEGIFAEIAPISATPANPHPVNIRFTSPNRTTLETAIAPIGDSKTIRRIEGGSIEKWAVAPDLESAAEQSITPADIALSTAAATGGIPAGLLHTTDASDPTPILLKAQGDDDPLEALEDAYVHRDKGDPVRLIDVAEITPEEAPAALTRFNSQPSAHFAVGVTSDQNSVQWERKLVSDYQSSTGSTVSVAAAGDSHLASEANSRVLRHIPVVALLIALFLLIQTRSLRASIIILAAVPPALAGAALGLHAAGFGFGLMALLGMTSLGGIVVNNAILLIDSIRNPSGESPHAGIEPPPLHQQIATASASRLGPVVLTALCSALGMAPLLVSGDPLWSPFVAAMVGGLAIATLITLFALPLLYALTFRR